jgi:hypothetical protein
MLYHTVLLSLCMNIATVGKNFCQMVWREVDFSDIRLYCMSKHKNDLTLLHSIYKSEQT